jgi:hypothetical protein
LSVAPETANDDSPSFQLTGYGAVNVEEKVPVLDAAVPEEIPVLDADEDAVEVGNTKATLEVGAATVLVESPGWTTWVPTPKMTRYAVTPSATATAASTINTVFKVIFLFAGPWNIFSL